MKNYILNLFVSISQLLNTLFAGNPDELLSSRAYREDIGWLIWLINFIFQDKLHCKVAYEYEQSYPRPTRKL
jgi:hypothetical protein